MFEAYFVGLFEVVGIGGVVRYGIEGLVGFGKNIYTYNCLVVV